MDDEYRSKSGSWLCIMDRGARLLVEKRTSLRIRELAWVFLMEGYMLRGRLKLSRI